MKYECGKCLRGVEILRVGSCECPFCGYMNQINIGEFHTNVTSLKFHYRAMYILIFVGYLLLFTLVGFGEIEINKPKFFLPILMSGFYFSVITGVVTWVGGVVVKVSSPIRYWFLVVCLTSVMACCILVG